MKRNKAGLMRDYRAVNDWYVKHEADGQWSVVYLRPLSWLSARRRAVKSRREAWL